MWETTCSGAVGVLARCLSRLLGIPGPGIVIGKLRNIGIAAALTTLIVVMVIVASAGTGLVRRLHVDAVFIRLAVPLISPVDNRTRLRRCLLVVGAGKRPSDSVERRRRKWSDLAANSYSRGLLPPLRRRSHPRRAVSDARRGSVHLLPRGFRLIKPTSLEHAHRVGGAGAACRHIVHPQRARVSRAPAAGERPM